jgi:hypothetical protein
MNFKTILDQLNETVHAMPAQKVKEYLKKNNIEYDYELQLDFFAPGQDSEYFSNFISNGKCVAAYDDVRSNLYIYSPPKHEEYIPASSSATKELDLSKFTVNKKKVKK